MLDTLVCDTARIGAWQRCGQYAYNDQLVHPDHSAFDELLVLLGRWFSEKEYEIENFTTTQILAFFAIVGLLLIVAYWLYQNRYRWAGRVEKQAQRVDYTVTDENIYGVDFDKLLQNAVRTQNHSETVRLVYLRQLRRLADAGILYWIAGQTPDDYVLSIPPGEDRNVLRRLTAAYVRIRFGHYQADAATANEMLRLADAHQPQVEKGGLP